MNRFNKIICFAEPADRAATALQQAMNIARQNDAQLTLTSIVNEIPILAPSIQQSFIEIRHAELEDLLKSVDTSGINSNIDVQVGSLGALHLIRTVIE